jgi:hypothetical protein
LRAARNEPVVWTPGKKPAGSAGFVFWINIPPAGIGFWVSGDEADFASSSMKEYIEKAVEAAMAALAGDNDKGAAVMTLRHLLGTSGVAC